MPAGVRRTAFATLVTSLVALTTAAVAYAGNGGFLPGEAALAERAPHPDAFIFVAIFTGIIFVGVEGALIVFIVKYRRGKRAADGRRPADPRLDAARDHLDGRPGRDPRGDRHVRLLQAARASTTRRRPRPRTRRRSTIEGHQFYWQFRYPNGAVSIDRMVAPADQVVNEDVSAPIYDVIHSWWVPDFGGKYDAIPGTVNKTWFKAPAGDYRRAATSSAGSSTPRCTRRCTSCRARSTTRSSRDARRQRASRRSGRRSGRACARSATASTALHRAAARREPAARQPRRGIEQLLRNGRGQMPAVGDGWTDAQIDALVAYTKQFAKAGRADGRQRRRRSRRTAPTGAAARSRRG